MVGGLGLGVAESMLNGYATFLGGTLQLTVAFVIIVLVLVSKPTGLFGTAEWSECDDDRPSKRRDQRSPHAGRIGRLPVVIQRNTRPLGLLRSPSSPRRCGRAAGPSTRAR